MKNITFSVVIPLYNKVDSIQKTINSVLSQKRPPEEIIVVNDGSTDGSEKIVKEMGITNLRLINQVNTGVSAARNKGVDVAQSNFIAFLDADDIWSPFYLSKMAELIERFPSSKCFASAYQKQLDDQVFTLPKVATGKVNPDGSLINDYFRIVANGDLPFMMSSVIFDRAFYQKIGGCPVGENMGEDQSLFASAAFDTSIAYTPHVLLSYRTDSENRACDINAPTSQLPFATRLMNNAENFPISRRKNIKKYCGAVACHLAKRHIQAGNIDVARKLLNEPGVKEKPFHWAALNLACFYKTSLTKISPKQGATA